MFVSPETKKKEKKKLLRKKKFVPGQRRKQEKRFFFFSLEVKKKARLHPEAKSFYSHVTERKKEVAFLELKKKVEVSFRQSKPKSF